MERTFEIPGRRKRRRYFQKKYLLFYISIFLIITAVVVYFQSARFFPSLGVMAYRETNIASSETKPKFYAPLSGIPVDEAIYKRRPIGSMVENTPDARPQSGLNTADIVMEAPAEGGITRFYSIWQSREATEIGPIRSARPYYVSWAAGFRAAYAHIGQSPEGLTKLKALGDSVVPDINFGFRFGSGYKRVTFRYAPHNVYSSTKHIRAIVHDLRQDKPGTYPGYLFKDDLALELRPASQKVPKIDFQGYGGDTYTVNYKYDRATNSYLRTVGGAAHRDRLTKKQLSIKNVIIQFHPNPSFYASGHGRINVNTLGSGRAILLRDGKSYNITWSKKDDKSHLTYKDEFGYEVLLNRGGTTWVSAVFPYSTVK